MSGLDNPAVVGIGAAIVVVVLSYILLAVLKGLTRGAQAIKGMRTSDSDQPQQAQGRHQKPVPMVREAGAPSEDTDSTESPAA